MAIPIPEFVKNVQLSQLSALTVGLVPFTFVLFLIDSISNQSLSHKFSLYPGAPLHFDLNRLSFYLLFHQNLVHWLFNIIALCSPLHYFEKSHGTIYTGITLNLLAVIAGLQYCIVGLLFSNDVHVIGLSGVVFLFLSFYAVKEYQYKPIIYRGRVGSVDIIIPTLYSPFISLILVTVIFPGSSFFGHLAGISAGYLLGFDKLKFLYPPLKVVVFIEQKLSKLIKLLDGVVDFIGEEDGMNLRNVAYTPMLTRDVEAGVLPTTDSTSGFDGPGHVLGTN